MHAARNLAPLLALALTGCGGCDDGRLETVNAAIVVEPSPLDLGEVPLEVTTQGVLRVRNDGGVPLRLEQVELEPAEGFELTSVPEAGIPPGASEVVIVKLRRSELGRAETVLRIQSNDPDRPLVRVRVLAQIVEPPPCDDGNVCTTDRFDPEANACEHSFADGTACESKDRCIIDAVCSRGVCLGNSKICDDANPCTADFCRQSDGECVFIEDEDVCDDDNPCTVDSCEPSGCVSNSVPSGTPCDDGDLCTVDDACFSGVCTGSGLANGTACDDGDSCTVDDVCLDGVCSGGSILVGLEEGSVVFRHPLKPWPERAFLHRREVSLGDSGTFYGLDHLNLPDGAGLSHEVFAMEQCGTRGYDFSYRPPDSNVLVSYVRRGIQLDPQDNLRLFVGVRQRPADGFRPQTTAYMLDARGNVLQSQIQRVGGETGRSLLPDGSEVYAVVFPLTEGPGTVENPNRQNLVIVREDVRGDTLWTYERASGDWAEFFGVAGPRVLFWANNRFGAVDFNTGALVWSRETPFTSDEMALSAALDIGIIRTKPGGLADGGQLIAVEILGGDQIFAFPAVPDAQYFPRTEPVISASGVIGVMMQRNPVAGTPGTLEWVELDQAGQVLSTTPLPYVFPEDFGQTRHEDFRDDPYPTVADDGVYYVGYGDRFFAIDPNGTGLRWTLTSTLGADAFTGTVPLLRDDGVLLINEDSRQVLGVRTNGGRMSDDGWASFRHDGRRTNFTPAAPAAP